MYLEIDANVSLNGNEPIQNEDCLLESWYLRKRDTKEFHDESFEENDEWNY